MITAGISVGVTPEPGDMSREAKRFFEWAPSRSLLASIRSYQRWRSNPLGWPLAKLAVLRHRLWSVVTAADIPLNCRLGRGLMIPHPTGVVIHPDAEIGPDCLIMSGVTIGTRASGVPVLGAHVDVYSGAKVLGGVRIGDYAKIGANAVVVKDVQPGATMVGIPAVEIGCREIPRAPAWVGDQQQIPAWGGLEGMNFKDAAVLDVGCGTGKDLLHSAYSMAKERCGIDIDASRIAYGKAHYPDIKLTVGHAESLPYPTGHFDFVVSRVALPYTQIPLALQEIHRVLKSDGDLLLTMHDWRLELRWIGQALRAMAVKSIIRHAYVIVATVGFSLTGWVMPQPWGGGRECFQTEGNMRRALRRAGFSNISFERHPRRWIVKAKRDSTTPPTAEVSYVNRSL